MVGRATRSGFAFAAALLALAVAWPGTPPGFVVHVENGSIDKPDPVVRPSVEARPASDERACDRMLPVAPLVVVPPARARVAVVADRRVTRFEPRSLRGAVAPRAPPAV
jgi:hypothetical protein